MLCLLLAIGCDYETEFEIDATLHAKNGLSKVQSASIDSELRRLFGTPDEPALPEAAPRLAELVDSEALAQASGPVISHTPGVTQGLYRRHCARCHGITGNGRGPTARYQAPYPRDFRRGVFKWKSTYRDAPPTRADLDRTLEYGIAGAAMPSFKLLTEEERSTLRQYVVYLAVRGQVERELVSYLADEAPAGEAIDFTPEELADLIEPIVDAWADAEKQVVSVPAALDGDASLGRELYHSERAGCYKCHGQEGQGGAVAGVDYEVDYDLWNRDRLPTGDTKVDQQLAYDLPAKSSRPRRLVKEMLKGGQAPSDLFRRIHQGIAGTPMPAVGGTSADNAGSLTDEEIAALAVYTQTLVSPKETTKKQRNQGN